MIYLTKHEQAVCYVLAAVIIGGSAVELFSKQYPAMKKEINSPQQFVYKTNINTASKDELVRVPYIGEMSARAIVEYRRKNGYFQSLDELTQVPGVYFKNYQKMRPYITL